jgi:hypothetical protein
MNNTYGCAPIYFSGAILFLAGGATLIYFKYTILGGIVITPGIILLGLTFITSFILFRIKRSDDVRLVISEIEPFNELNNHKKTHIAYKKQKRKKRKRLK